MIGRWINKILAGHKNGCHNRKPFQEKMVAQDGWFMDGVTRYPKMISSEFRMSSGCEYSKTELGKKDNGCTDCKWRQKD